MELSVLTQQQKIKCIKALGLYISKHKEFPSMRKWQKCKMRPSTATIKKLFNRWNKFLRICGMGNVYNIKWKPTKYAIKPYIRPIKVQKLFDEYRDFEYKL